MNALSLYIKMIGLSIRSQMQYRMSFVMSTIGNALGAFIEYLGVWAFFARFGSLGDWTLADAGVFYGMGHIAFALAEMFARGFDVFHQRVRTGEFDRTLLRPRSTVLLLLGEECQVMRIGRLIQGAAVLAVGLSWQNATWGFDRWLLMLLTVIGGAFLFSCISVLQATSAFWTVESIEVWNCITFGGVSTVQYPLSIYQKPLRYLFSYLVPLAAANYWPCAYLLGRDYVPVWVSWASPLLGVLSFLLSLRVWRFGVRHYRSTGS